MTDTPESQFFFEPLARKAAAVFGAAHSPRGRARLKSAAEAALARLGLGSFSELESLLRREPERWDELWPRALASEGALSRPAAQFEVAGELLAEWSLTAPDRRLRVLSLGCGPGYETCSLAMMLEETGLKAKNWQVEIRGADLNPEAVDRARRMVFTNEDLKWLPEPARRKWFIPRAGGFHFKTALAPEIRVVQANIFDPDSWPGELAGPFDLIFSRGLTWEAPPQAPRRLALLARRLLGETGFIFTAPGELWPDDSGELALEERDGVLYYRRGPVKIKVNRHHQPRRDRSRRPDQPPPPAPTEEIPLREKQLLAQARAELDEGRPEEARDLLGEVFLGALDRYQPAPPEAWALTARLEEALGRPDSARAATLLGGEAGG